MNHSLRSLLAAVGSVALFVAPHTAPSSTASPLLEPPPPSVNLSAAPDVDGAVHSVTAAAPGQFTGAITRDEVTYGTGVRRGTEAETGTMNVLTPPDPSGHVLVYAPATDSLYPGDAPSRKIGDQALSDSDVEHIEAALSTGATVIVPDVYGPVSPQYAGTFNGVRIINAVEAYSNLPGRSPTTEATCYGFSGGGIDCARVLESPHASAQFDTVIVDSGPTDLAGFLARPAAQNGLGWSAAVGLQSSMTTEQQAALHRHLRPSAVVGAKALRLAGDIIPVPGLVAGVMTIGGALVPLPLESAFLPGALDEPEVQALLGDISPTTQTTPFDGSVILRYNATDAFVPPAVHAYPFAENLRAQGTEVAMVIDHGEPAPGHAMMQPEELATYLTSEPVAPTAPGTLGELVELILAEALEPVTKGLDPVVTAALDGLADHGDDVAAQAPPVLDSLDRTVIAADRDVDRGIAAAEGAAETSAAVTSNTQATFSAVSTQVATLAGEARQVVDSLTAGQRHDAPQPVTVSTID